MKEVALVEQREFPAELASAPGRGERPVRCPGGSSLPRSPFFFFCLQPEAASTEPQCSFYDHWNVNFYRKKIFAGRTCVNVCS